jgi:hypothetical protein
MVEQKRGRGQPLHYEARKEKRNLRITDTAWDKLGEAATALGLSRSEVVERIARGDVEVCRYLCYSESKGSQ